MKGIIYLTLALVAAQCLVGCSSQPSQTPAAANAPVTKPDGSVVSHGVTFPPEAVKAGAVAGMKPK